MRKSLVAIIAVVALLAVVIPFGFEVNAEEPTDNANYHLTGQMMHDDVFKSNPNDIVIILENSTKELGRTTTVMKDTGQFTIDLSEKLVAGEYTLTISEQGYSIISMPDCMSITGENNKFKLTLTGEQGDDVSITSVGHYIMASKTVGSFKGTVLSSSGDHPPLNGVKVILFDLETKKEVASTFTSNKGVFEFNEILVGEYGLKAEGKGFQSFTYDGTVRIASTGTPSIEIQMMPSEEIDTAHMMTMIGTIIAAILLLCIAGHIVKTKRRRN